MKTVVYLFSLLCITAFLQGCATPNISKDSSFDRNSPKGLLVGSITYDGYYADYWVYIRNVKTNEIYKVEAGGAGTPFHLFDPKGNLDHLGIKGDLFAVELDPGEYEAYSWSVGPGNRLRSKENFSIKLRIDRGAALYFGSVNFKQTETFGVTVSGVKVFYLSQYDRDSVEFRKNYPHVSLPEIHNALRKGDELALGEDVKPAEAILFEAISNSLLYPPPSSAAK